MGLQTWPPSTAPLPPHMACLDVETPTICRGKFKSVLQLCLQQRRTREQLVEQGIMPPLKTPASFHEQIRSLERARTGNFLKHKLCNRPERSELVRMHILQEPPAGPSPQAGPSLMAAQMKLKRARLADDLNEKIAQRPGPMELVEKNILPVDEGVTEVTEGEKPKTPDVYSFDEDSSDALSPERPSSRGSEASPRGAAAPEAAQLPPDPAKTAPAGEPQSGQQAAPAAPTAPAPAATATAPVLVKQSQARPHGEKARGSKKSREPKPRVRKLKYHQYVPPDHRAELSEGPSMDSAYARLLQQQQQFLQLQILSQQQQQQLSYQPLTHTNTHNRATAEAPTSCSNAPPRHAHAGCRRQQLPANLDEMKVAELKTELKLRSLPVSGTKTDLIERLRSYQEASGAPVAMETKPEHAKLTPPLSPIASKVSSMDIEDSGAGEGPADAPEENGAAGTEGTMGAASSEKDKRLHEKERQIEELKRKLEEEQRLVEELKLQLEVEKRSQLGEEPPRLGLGPLTPPPHIKDETPPSCAGSSPRRPLKQEEEQQSPAHFVLGHQPVQAATTGLTLAKTWTMETPAQDSGSVFPASGRPGGASEAHPDGPPSKQPTFTKCRDPPRYEDAVKQTRLLTAAQGFSAASQQMDDLFAVLIESGEISPFIKPDPPGPEKPLPVTASVTTLPINTVLSRPPALIQVAKPPDLGLTSDPLLDAGDSEAQALKLMAAMEVDFGEEASALSGVDSMDWLDLTLAAPAEGGGEASAPPSVFAFLDSHELQLSWD